MMANDYPPMDKEILAKLLTGEVAQFGVCPWGCGTTWPSDLAGFDDDPTERVHRVGLKCPKCERCYTLYSVMGGEHPYFTMRYEILAGWPPDALEPPVQQGGAE